MKKNPNLLTKIILPIVIVGVILSYVGFLYLNTVIEETVNHEIEQKAETKIHYVYDRLKTEFELLFYLHGKSNEDYKTQESLAKKEVINYLKQHAETEDILYIIDPNEYIKIYDLGLTSIELSTIIRKKQNEILLNGKNYMIVQSYFKPWDWRIVYLLDISSFEDIIEKNKQALLGIIYILLFVLVGIVIITFKMFIKDPVDLLLNHFSLITKGEYPKLDDIKYNTDEIDKLIDNVNDMTKSIEYREDEAKTLLALTRQNEEYMTDILSSQSSIIFINDTVEIIDVNDSFLKFFDMYENLNEFKKVHKCVCDYFIEEEGFIYNFSDKNWVEYILKNPNLLHKVKILKDEKYYIFTIQAIKSEKYERIIITMTDITELEKSNNLLQEYKKAVDAGAIVSKTDIKGKITYVNDRFIDIAGFKKEELIGSNHNIVNSPNTPKETFKELWETIMSKNIWYGNIENRKKDGTPYFVTATIIPILDENQQIIEYIGLRYDITEQVQAVEKAKKAENTKSLFLANMSHEIRTPLNAIIGFTKILKNSTLEKKETNYIDIIDKSAENLLGIVNDILDLSKIENGSLVCESIEFNPFKEFHSIVDLFLSKTLEKNINFISNIDPKILQKIIGDPLRIKQVLSNLISNAIKFSHDNSDITLDIKLLSQEDTYCMIEFSVQDNGIGISLDKQKTIFDDFTQADDSTSREYGGTGLGLSISNKIINALGSNIQIESIPDKGSRFYFTLKYNNNVQNNKNMEELNKLKVAIVEFDEIYDYQHLFQYIDFLTDVTVYKNTKDIDETVNYDILYILESDVDDKIMQLDQNKNTKIVVLAKEKIKCEKLKNGRILNLPFNRSTLFDMLVELMDNNNIYQDDKDQYTQYTGEVLIAEDHVVNQQLISMLMELRGIKFIIVSNGQEAVELFKTNRYDLVLMDINMPIKNGKDATEEIIAWEKQQGVEHTPIVALTANVIETDKKETMAIGFDGYLHKPIDEVKLDATFTKYLEMKKSYDVEAIEEEIEEIKEKNVVFSLEDISKKMGLPSVVVKKIVTSFTTTIDEDLGRLKEAVDEMNFENIQDVSHKIKGAALNLRMENIAQYASSIEKQAIEKNNLTIVKDYEKLVKEILVVQESL